MKAIDLVHQDFLKGNYASALQSSVWCDIDPQKRDAKEIRSWIWLKIGALCFTGQQEEAVSFFHLWLPVLPSEEIIACRFYLGVGWTRRSLYSEGLSAFTANLREYRNCQTARAGFYAYQGAAFYRYFTGRYRNSEVFARHAYRDALAVKWKNRDFDHGKILALDLLAHCHVCLGEIRSGLQEFRRALEIAEEIGNGGICNTIKITLLTMEAQFGLSPKKSIPRIEKAWNRLRVEDTYSRTELQLELVRQNILRGRCSEARRLLNEACDAVYSNGNRRQAATLNLRFSYLLFLSGESVQANHLLRTAEHNLVPNVDRTHLAQMQGLRAQIGMRSADNGTLSPLETQLKSQSKLLGGFLNQRILFRGTQDSLRINRGEDPLGDLIDQIDAHQPEALNQLLEWGYLGLVYRYIRSEQNQRILLFDLSPGTLTVLDQGDVFLIEKGVNGIVRKILHRLALGPASKEVLITEAWGLRYHPLRHNPLIHTAIGKLRKSLGNHAHWIEWTEDGYRLATGITVRSTRLRTQEKRSSLNSSNIQLNSLPPPKDSPLPISSNWNYRQIQIIELLREARYTGAMECARLFDVSRITACRDLSQLRKAGILAQSGRGRATRYSLNPLPKEEYAENRKGSL